MRSWLQTITPSRRRSGPISREEPPRAPSARLDMRRNGRGPRTLGSPPRRPLPRHSPRNGSILTGFRHKTVPGGVIRTGARLGSADARARSGNCVALVRGWARRRVAGFTQAGLAACESAHASAKVVGVSIPGQSSMSVTEFVAAMAEASPEARSLRDEHLADYAGDLLIHVLMSDFQRLARDLYDRGELAALKQLLTIVDEGLRSSDERLTNAVAVSFVENADLFDASAQPFICAWPKGLREEAASQVSWYLERSSPPAVE